MQLLSTTLAPRRNASQALCLEGGVFDCLRGRPIRVIDRLQVANMNRTLIPPLLASLTEIHAFAVIVFVVPFSASAARTRIPDKWRRSADSISDSPSHCLQLTRPMHDVGTCSLGSDDVDISS